MRTRSRCVDLRTPDLVIMLLLLHITVILAQTDFIETANQQLLNLLLNHSYYEKDVRPSPPDGGPLVVTIIPNMFTLLTMDQQQETIEYFCEFMMMWNDPQLSWEPNETDYTADWIKVPERDIWVPDIVFDRSISHADMINKQLRVVDVRRDGMVRQSAPAVIVTNCHLDIESFPYDNQECTISIGSWIFDDSEIIIKSYYEVVIPGLEFSGNNEWDLMSMTAEQNVQIDGDRNYSIIDYRIALSRKPVYYVLVIQAPTFIIGTLTLFGIFTPFNVHGERKERVTLGLTMLLSITMMFNLVSDMMPKAARLPLLGNYILIEIFTCSVAVLISIVLLYAHHTAHTRLIRPPAWVQKALTITSCDFFHKPRIIDELLYYPPKNNLLLTLDTDGCAALKQLLQLRAAIASTVHQVSKKIAHLESAEWIRFTWTRVFDFFDLTFLIAFQILNVLMAVIYMRSPEFYIGILNQTVVANHKTTPAPF